MEKIREFTEQKLHYDDRLSFYCVKNCYWNVLSFYNIYHAPLNLNAELSMVIKLNNNPFDFTIELIHDPLIPSQAWHEIQYISNKLFDSFHEIQWLIRMDFPIIIAVDGYFLPYHDFFQKQHEQHSVILSGLDMNKCFAELIDYFPPTFFRGKIQLDHLSNAFLNRWSFLQKESWKTSSEDLLLETLRRTFTSMLQDACDDKHLAGNKAFEFLGKILQMLDVLGDKEIFRYVHGQLNKYSNKLRFLQFYLQQAAKYTANKQIEDIIDEITCQVKIWRVFTVSLLRNVYSNKMNHLFCRQFDNIICRQQRLVELFVKLHI